MAKLNRAPRKAHDKAEAIMTKDRLTDVASAGPR